MAPEQLERIRASVLSRKGDLRSEAEALLREVDRLLALNLTMTEYAIRLLGSNLCERHQEKAKRQSFASFCEESVSIGCDRCLKEKVFTLEAATRGN